MMVERDISFVKSGWGILDISKTISKAEDWQVLKTEGLDNPVTN
ncbi:MAG TPA: hypothetical protein VFD00_07985 [Thermoclostridium sp.]|nr:hypothetical protein [Thermoclostridium sp.]